MTTGKRFNQWLRHKYGDFAQHADKNFVKMEIQLHLAFVKAIALDNKVMVATSMGLAKQVEGALDLTANERGIPSNQFRDEPSIRSETTFPRS